MKGIVLSLLFFSFFLETSFSQEDSTMVKSIQVQYDSISQRSPVSFNEAQIEKYQESEDFEYLEKLEEDSWWTRFKRWLNLKFQRLLEYLFGDFEPGTFLKFIFNILPELIIAILLGFAVWLFIRLNPGKGVLNTQPDPMVNIGYEEELVKATDLDKLINEAIKDKNYRLAIRYYYLQNLKLLDKSNFIEYQFEKTNEDYSAEIKDGKIREQFKKSSRIYEYIWYGDFTVIEDEFSRIAQVFLEINTLIKTPANE